MKGKILPVANEAAAIVELFEALLDKFDITLPSPEDDERDEDNTARLYGTTYWDLVGEVEDIVADVAKRAKAGEEIVEGTLVGDCADAKLPDETPAKTLDELMERIGDHFDCRCELEDDEKTVIIQTDSPEGQDVFCEIELDTKANAARIKELVRELQCYADNFDPDEEAALWIGPDGHGKNGAPYHIRDLIEDMDWCDKFWQDVAEYAAKNI